MKKYLVSIDYSFVYNNEQYCDLDKNIIVESSSEPTNPVDIHKAIAKTNNIPWLEWGKVYIDYIDINSVTTIDIVSLDDKKLC